MLPWNYIIALVFLAGAAFFDLRSRGMFVPDAYTYPWVVIAAGWFAATVLFSARTEPLIILVPSLAVSLILILVLKQTGWVGEADYYALGILSLLAPLLGYVIFFVAVLLDAAVAVLLPVILHARYHEPLTVSKGSIAIRANKQILSTWFVTWAKAFTADGNAIKNYGSPDVEIEEPAPGDRVTPLRPFLAEMFVALVFILLTAPV